MLDRILGDLAALIVIIGTMVLEIEIVLTVEETIINFPTPICMIILPFLMLFMVLGAMFGNYMSNIVRKWIYGKENMAKQRV
jgi:hypothetical protein